jgi:beta-glucanase (GH16 family)
MKKISFCLFLCSWISLSCQAQETRLTDTLFFDDFSGKSLDRSKWNVEVSENPPNHEQEAYIDSSATLYISHGIEARDASGGVLVIQPVYSPGFNPENRQNHDLLSARVNTRNKVEFTYGKVSARMKLPKGDGFWPAFWILGNGPWPQTGEIDVMENIGDSSWVSAAMHGPGYHGNTPLVKRFHFPLGTDVSQWHVYAVNWTSDSLVFSVDDIPFYTVTRNMVTAYGPWAFDNPKFLIVNLALGGGYPQGNDHISLPYFGIPQSTVDEIKNGDGKVITDWVLILRQRQSISTIPGR